MRDDAYVRALLMGVFPSRREFPSETNGLHAFFYEQQQDGNALLQGIWFAEQIVGHHCHQIDEAIAFMRVAGMLYHIYPPCGGKKTRMNISARRRTELLDQSGIDPAQLQELSDKFGEEFFLS